MNSDNRPQADAQADRALRDRSLDISLRDGMAWSVMVGFGDSFLGPFALLCGATTIQMGWLLSLPAALGAISQVVAARLADRLRSRRRVIVPAAMVQALAWIFIFAAPILIGPSMAATALIFCVGLMHIGGHFIAPVWHSLMGDLVPSDIRGVYFARRNRICHIVTVLSVAIAGGILQLFQKFMPGYPAAGFIAIFSVACAARLASARYLSIQYEPPFMPVHDRSSGVFEFIRSMPRTDIGRFALFSACMNFAVFLSAPLFVVYIMQDLRFTYIQFTLVNVFAVLAQIVTLVFLGKAADRFGNRWALIACGSVIAIGPLFLPLSPTFIFVIIFTLFMSAAGAGYNLASANYLFDSVPPARLAHAVACVHMTNAVGILLGGVTGGWLAGYLASSAEFGPMVSRLASPILAVFLISAFLRILILMSFKSTLAEHRPVDPMPSARLLFGMAFRELDSIRRIFPHK